MNAYTRTMAYEIIKSSQTFVPCQQVRQTTSLRHRCHQFRFAFDLISDQILFTIQQILNVERCHTVNVLLNASHQLHLCTFVELLEKRIQKLI